jgi:equilibrative nucleoside transporter 1/2/3
MATCYLSHATRCRYAAVDYFEMLYPGKHINRLFGVLYFIPNLTTLPLVLRFGHVVSPRARVRFGYTMFLVCLIVPSIHAGGLGLLCVAVMLTGVADASAQGSLFGAVAPMPEKYTQALMGGTSFSVGVGRERGTPPWCALIL